MTKTTEARKVRTWRYCFLPTRHQKYETETAAILPQVGQMRQSQRVDFLLSARA